MTNTNFFIKVEVVQPFLNILSSTRNECFAVLSHEMAGLKKTEHPKNTFSVISISLYKLVLLGSCWNLATAITVSKEGIDKLTD